MFVLFCFSVFYLWIGVYLGILGCFRVHFESNWSLFYIVWLFVRQNDRIKALWHIARVRRLQLSNRFFILKTPNLFGLMRKVKIDLTIKDFSKLIGIGRQGWHIWADFKRFWMIQSWLKHPDSIAIFWSSKTIMKSTVFQQKKNFKYRR